MSGRIIDADVDAIANIDRLTAQVAAVAKQRDEYASLLGHWKGRHRQLQEQLAHQDTELRSAIATYETAHTEIATLQGSLLKSIVNFSDLRSLLRKSDAQRDELQAMLTACEAERDGNNARAEYLLMDRDAVEAKRVELRDRVSAIEAERDEHYRKLTVYWSTFGGCGDAAGMKFVREKEALRERVGVLETALRRLRCQGTNNLVGTDTRRLGNPCRCNSCVAARVLWISPPAIDPDELSAAVLKAGGRVTYGDSCSCAQPDGPPICPVHHRDCAPVARDASVDDWEGVNLDPVAHKLAIVSERDKEIDRLRADLAAANEKAKINGDEFEKKLAAANEEIARLKVDWMAAEKDAAKARVALDAEKRYRINDNLDAREAHAATTARLSRAVAALQEAGYPVARDASVDAPRDWELHVARTELRDLGDAVNGIVAERDRLRADLAAANEEIARLKGDNAEGDKALDWLRAQVKSDSDHAEKMEAAHAATTAKLSRAVAALDWALSFVVDNAAITTLPVYVEARAILADEDSEAAGEAWEATMRVALHFVDLLKRANMKAKMELGFVEGSQLGEDVAAVDARRGQGGGR